MTKRIGNVFYGWWMVVAGIVLCGFGYGAWYYSFGALFVPISTQFGWARATTSIAFSLSRLEGGFEGLATGPLTDKYGPRLMVRVGWVLAALGFILMSQINSFWMFILTYSLLLSLGMNAGLYMPIQTAIAKWFNEKRGLALGFVTSGAALGGAILVPITAWLITDYGWKTAVVVLGIAALAVGLSMSFILKPRGPEHYGLRMDGKAVEPTRDVPDPTLAQFKERDAEVSHYGLSLREAMKTPAFWLIVIAFTFSHTALSAIVVHQIPFIEDMGVSKIVAASALGTMTLVSVPGRLSGGWLADRMNVKWLYVMSSLGQAVGLFIFSKATGMSLVWTFVVIYGVAYGLRIPLEAVMRAKYFGPKAFGSIMGYINAFAILGSFAGPFVAGWIFDTTGSYASAFLILAAMMVVGAIVVLFLKPPLTTSDTP